MLNHRFGAVANGQEAKDEHERHALLRGLALRGLGRPGPLFLLTFACCLFVAGCRMDMQDQPKYKVYRSSNFFKDGLSSRQLPEGTVPRGYLRTDAALYTGKVNKTQAGQSGSGGGSAATSGQNTQAGQQNRGDSGSGASASSGGGQGQGGGSSSNASGASGGGTGNANIYEGDVDTFPFPITQEIVDRGEERYKIFCSMCHGLSGYGDGMIVRRGYRKPPSYYEDNLRRAPVGHFYDVITKGWGAMPAYADQIPVQDRWAIIAYIRALQLTVPPGSQPNNGSDRTEQTLSSQPRSPQQQQRQQSQQGQPSSSQTPNTGGVR